MIPHRKKIEDSLARVRTWVHRNRYQGYEPADGNLSWLFAFTRGRVFPMRVLQQVVLRAPFNIRPVFGIAPHESAIGRGYLAWGYLLWHRATRDEALRREATDCLEWLGNHRSPRSEEFCWGDPYEYATRGGRRPYEEPLLIWSALIGQAFLDAYEWLYEDRYLEIARSIGRWILALPREQTATGTCLSYVAYRQSSIHNSNAMGAAFLGRLGSLTGHQPTLDTARSAMTYLCTRQREDGSWNYAEEPKFHWIDNFHTGYNLSALLSYRNATKDDRVDACFKKGLSYFMMRFFDGEGRPKYFHDQLYPIDIQCAAQAIDTLSLCAGEDPACLPLATKIADWTIDHLQAADGHFKYRDLGWTKVTTPMLHWGQGTMMKALAQLLGKLVALPEEP